MRLAFMLAAAFAVALQASAQEAAHRVIITFKSGTPAAERQQVLTKLGATSVADIVSNGKSDAEFVAVVAQAPQGASAGAAAFQEKAKSLMALDASPELSDVVKIEDDYKVKWIEAAPASFQAMPFGSFQAVKFTRTASASTAANATLALGARSKIPWGIARVKAPAAWDYTQGAGVRVAVIDTGIDTTHPDLDGAVDGGYNAQADCERVDCYQDDNGHGTHVAGTIAGRGAGQWGVYGVAPKARLYAVKVLGSDGSGALSDVIKGIIWCANNDIQVANMSLGSDTPSDTMQKALRYAKARGVVVVAAAGNSGGAVGYPGAYPETIAVAAADWDDKVASFSSRGPQVKFIAPGVAVLSSKMGGDYWTLSGTSMATPHVTGLAALAVSEGYRGLDGPDGVLEQLKKAAKPILGLSSDEQGFGMIDGGKLTRSERSVAIASN